MAIFNQPETPLFLAMQGFSFVMTGVIASAAFQFRSVESALGFYGVYHQMPWNQFLHFFGVPGIIWSYIVFLAHLQLPFAGGFVIRVPWTEKHHISYATVTALFYLLFYIKIDPFGGTLYAPVVFSWYVTAVNWTRQDQLQAKQQSASGKSVQWYGTTSVLKWSALVHVLSWYVQIHPGHAVIEGAKPALFDSLAGALSSAPLFAFYEGLWFLGINKELQAKTLELVSENTARLCAEGATMRICETLA
jgi:2-hydroxy fatty acid dioxygenase